ncbi:MAG: DegT/DnrJ/EryC1/StrS family aminotransferase [Deltaproteobacteria bacterium]|nr:DegT/DnrJ/EryC1/StrS family aminotransferase [Deltaproteobacteria bacterium]
MNIPLLDLKAQLDPIHDEIMAAVAETVDSTCYIMGPRIEQFEKNMARYCGAKEAIGVSSGTDALLASLMALGVGNGDLVLTTPYSFFATMGSILRLGAQPVFADIDPVSYNIDPARVAALLADSAMAGRIKAILPVHLFGQCAEMGPLLKMAGEYNIPVVEDAAQAIGAAYPMMTHGALQWQRAGTMGDCGCFSFFPSKNLGGMGDGGMVVTNNEKLAKALRLIRVHGDISKYQHAVVGGNFRLDALQAAILNVKLPYLHKWHAARRQNATLYNGLFKESGLVEAGHVVPPRPVYQESAALGNGVDYHIYNQYVIRAKNRDGLREFLQEQSIGVAVYYPIPLHKQKCISGLPSSTLSLPEAEKAAGETLALPIYPELTSDMQEYVVDRISAFYQR